jgi:uncharacterized protein (DUF3820 family)
MSYEVFPFGKYKGILISELPTTYLAHALESFDLPEELKTKMVFIFLHKINFVLNDHVVSENDFFDACKSVYKKYHELDRPQGSYIDGYEDLKMAIRSKF